MDDEIRKGLLTWLILHGDRRMAWVGNATEAFAACPFGTMSEAYKRGYFDGDMRTPNGEGAITISAKGLEFLNGKS